MQDKTAINADLVSDCVVRASTAALPVRHTPGPWRIKGRTHSSGEFLRIESSEEYQIADVIDANAFPQNKVNAARIVACVNACDGMPLSDVEKLAEMPSGVMQLTVYADALRDSHAKLIEALTLMCRSHGSTNPIPHESHYTTAYAALAAAKDLL